MQTQSDRSNDLSLQNPLNQSTLRKLILEVFPTYLDPDCREDRLAECEKSVKELKLLLAKECSDNVDAIGFLKEKLLIAIFQNPYPDCAKLFSKFFSDHFSEDSLEEPEVSLFLANRKIPSVLELGALVMGCEDEVVEAKVEVKVNESQSQAEESKCEEASKVKDNGTFKPSWPVIANHTKKEELRKAIGEIFNFNSARIPHLERILCWFPDYLVKFNNLNSCLFLGPGPIPIHQRYFIAIIASSNFGCEYLHSRLSQQFLEVGGSIEWLEGGLEKTDKKTQAIAEFAAKLAYQPHEVFKDPANLNDLKEKGWQKAELLHAAFIISFYHAMACVCLALGLHSELDMRNPQISIQTPFSNNLQSPRIANEGERRRGSDSFFANKDIVGLLQSMTITAEGEESMMVDGIITNIDNRASFTDADLPTSNSARSSMNNNGQSDSFIFDGSIKQPKSLVFEKFERFIGKTQTLTSEEVRVPQALRYSDFNFNAHGYQIANQYAAELAQTSLEILDTVKSMTNNNFNSAQGLSTQPFRKAIELYIQNIFGYTRYDADYKKEMNALLPIPLKSLLKLTVKTPYAVRAANITGVNLELMPNEITHIFLIAAHARLEIELIYFLNQFQKF